MNLDTVADARTLSRDLGRGEELYARARAHVDRLQAIEPPGVCVPLEVKREDDDRVIAIMPALEGTDLASLRRMRGALTLGECVTVGIGVAEALSVLHAHSLVHGDVSEANIMVVDGSIALVDVWGAVSEDEHGTEPYAAAERASTGPSAPDDIHALGAVLRECVHPEAEERMEAWCAPMLARDPQARPSASMVARALPACGAPSGIDVPDVGVAAAVRARAQGPHYVTTRLASGRSWRVWTMARRALVVGGVGLAAVAMLALGAHMVTAAAPV
ncbi:MAG: RIO1 family regulatory kinase/ATPase, partial [Demequina sp.]